jgi:phosphosulfolactate phosphohydrolase-like enzyme
MNDIRERTFAAAIVAQVALELQRDQIDPPEWESINGIDEDIVAGKIIDTIESTIMANHAALESIGQDGSMAFQVGAGLVAGVLKKLISRRPSLGKAAANESIRRMKESNKQDISRN